MSSFFQVIRAKRADTTTSESSSSTTTSSEASSSSDDESETGTDTDVSAKDGAGAVEKAKIKAGLQAALKSLDRVEKQLGGRDVEIQVDPPSQRTSEEPQQLNTELQSALEHLDNLTKQAPVIEKSLGDLVMKKADPIQKQTSASKKQETTKAKEENQAEVAPVLKTCDLTVQTSHNDEGWWMLHLRQIQSPILLLNLHICIVFRYQRLFCHLREGDSGFESSEQHDKP